MKRLFVFVVALLLLYSCKKDNNDCNEAIPFCNEVFLIIISQYVDVIMLLIPIGKLQNVTAY